MAGKKATGDREHETDKNKLPIDRGWAWVVVAACFFINLLHVGMYRCYGILFVEFLKEFNASASVTSLVVGVYSASYSITALFVLNILLDKFSVRQISFLGGIMLSLGGILSFFAMNLEFLIFAQSFLTGVGSALLYGPGLVIVGQYFEKRRALGQAISSCGVSLGGMIIPQLVRFLLNEYGLRGTLLISGGFLSHILIFSLLFRPPPIRKPQVENVDLNTFKNILSKDEFEIISIESLNDTQSQINIDHASNGHLEKDANGHTVPNMSYAKMLLQKREPFRSRTESDPTAHLRRQDLPLSVSVPNDSFLSNNSIAASVDGNSVTHIPGDRRSFRKRYKTEVASQVNSPAPRRKEASVNYFGSLMDTMSQSSYLKYASNADIHMMSTFSLNKPPVDGDPPEEELSCCKKIAGSFDFSVFRIPHFYLVLGQGVFGVCAISLYAAFLPASAQEVGLTDVQAALLITIYAGVDCVSRFLSGVIVESGTMKSHHLLATSLYGIGILYQLTRFYTSNTLMITYAALFGLFSGVMPAMAPVVMIDFLGLENFPKALGFVQVFHGIVLAGVTPLCGALRDVTGNYDASYHLLGTCGIIAGTFLFMEPIARRITEARKTKATADELKPLDNTRSKA